MLLSSEEGTLTQPDHGLDGFLRDFLPTEEDDWADLMILVSGNDGNLRAGSGPLRGRKVSALRCLMSLPVMKQVFSGPALSSHVTGGC